MRGAYTLGGDHNSDFLDGFSKLFGFDSSIIVEVEVLETLDEDGLLALGATGFLGQLLEQFLLKTKGTNKKVKNVYLALNDSISIA